MSQMYDCYVRIYVKVDDNGHIIEDYNDTSDKYAGHYDLQINKPEKDSTDLIYNQTVFSYGPRSSTNSKGTLKVFSADKTQQVMTNLPYQLFYRHFQATEEQVKNFKTKLFNTLSDTKHTTSTHLWYDVTSDGFKYYNFETANCFIATAFFTSWLGNDEMMNIYNDYKDWEDGHRNYFAWRMWVKYHPYWIEGDVYGIDNT